MTSLTETHRRFPTREAAIRLLRRGMITMSEAAELAGASRQLVRHWAMRAGIDPAAARRRYLERVWRR